MGREQSWAREAPCSIWPAAFPEGDLGKWLHNGREAESFLSLAPSCLCPCPCLSPRHRPFSVNPKFEASLLLFPHQRSLQITVTPESI